MILIEFYNFFFDLRYNMILLYILLVKKYFLITDAGSTATRMNAYSYDEENTAAPVLIGKESVRITLSTAVHNTNAIQDIFGPLLQWAKIIIPKENQKETILDVYGTSSMRQLERSDQLSILKSTRSYLRNDGTFSVDKYACHILSEFDEASFLWIALNTLNGNIPKCDSLIGSIEIASQNANFAANIKSTKNLKGWTTSVKFPSQSFDVYAPVFFGLGIDEVIINHTIKLAAKAGISEISSPCFLKGYKKSQENFIVSGTGDFDSCYEDLSENILNEKNCKKGLKCIFSNVPLVDYQLLYGLSTVFYTRQFFNLPETAKISEYVSKGKEFCSREYADVESENPDNEYIGRYCIYSAYITNFLQRGLGVTDNTELHITDTINGVELSYTLGVVISILNKINYNSNPLRWYEILTIVLLFVCFFGIIIGIIVCCCLRKKKKKLTENEIALLQYQWQESDSSYQRANGKDDDEEEELNLPPSARVANNMNEVTKQIGKTNLRIENKEIDPLMKDMVDGMAPPDLLQGGKIKQARTDADIVGENMSEAATKIGDIELNKPEMGDEKVEKAMGEMNAKIGDIKLENLDDTTSINYTMKKASATFQPDLQIKTKVEGSKTRDEKLKNNQVHPENIDDE